MVLVVGNPGEGDVESKNEKPKLGNDEEEGISYTNTKVKLPDIWRLIGSQTICLYVPLYLDNKTADLCYRLYTKKVATSVILFIS